MQSKKRVPKPAKLKRKETKPDAPGKTPLKIGLTGNIGSGKSTAALLFSELGAMTFDTDSVGHELLESDPNIVSGIVAAFGKNVVRNGLISREILGRIVFSNPEKREKLESILHPAIMSAIDRRLNQSDVCTYAVIEVPLLYEASLSGYFDYVILVKAEERSAIARASAKLGISEEDVLKRLNAQIPQSVKEKLADFTVANDGSTEDLKKKVVLLHAVLSSLGSAVMRTTEPVPKSIHD